MSFDAIGLRFAHLIGNATARTGTLRINVGIKIIIDFRTYYGWSHYLRVIQTVRVVQITNWISVPGPAQNRRGGT